MPERRHFATWEDAAEAVRVRQPTLPEAAVAHATRTCKLRFGGSVSQRPDAAVLERAAYAAARRDPDYRVRILSLERARRGAIGS